MSIRIEGSRISMSRSRWVALCIILGFSAPIAFVAVLGGSFYLHKAAVIDHEGMESVRNDRARASVTDFHVSLAIRRILTGENVEIHDHGLVDSGKVWPLGTVNAALLQAVQGAHLKDDALYKAARAVLVRAVHVSGNANDVVGPQTLYALSGEIAAQTLGDIPVNPQLTELAALAAFQAIRAQSRSSSNDRWLAFAEASCTIVPLLPGCLTRTVSGMVAGKESFSDLGRRMIIQDPPEPLQLPPLPAIIEPGPASGDL